MNESKDPDGDIDLLRKHCAQLSEHFDSVRIVVTKDGDGSTRRVSQGTGNWYAQYGSVKDWLMSEEEAARKEIHE